MASKLVSPPRLTWADLLVLGPALGACLLISVFSVWRVTFTIAGQRYLVLYDDAMISMRYARNLAAGFGLVWNPGEPPVEGYTNFLWTLWMALIHLTGVDESKSSLVVAGSGALILLGNAFLVWTIARSLAPAERWVAGVATWLTVLCYPVFYWTLAGLEVGLLTLLNSAAILLALRLRDDYHRRDLGVLAAVLSAGILTRTDQFVSCAVVLAFVVLTIPRTRRVEAIAVLGGAMLATVSLHTAFRLNYYGEPLPNTYYLKTQGFSLATRLSRGVAALMRSWLMFFTPVLVLAAVGLAKRARQVGAPLLLLLAIFGGQCAYSVSVGGDAWEWYNFPNRYITTGIPALLVLSAFGVASLVGAPLRMLVPGIAGLSALLGGGYWLGRQVDDFLRRPNSVPNVGMLVRDDGTDAFRRTIALQSGWVLLAIMFGVLLAAFCFRRLRAPGRLGALTAAVCTVAIVAASSGLPLFAAISRTTNRFSVIESYTRFGLALRQATAPEASIAVVWAGAIPYFDQRRSVDLLGKSDAVIAHGPPAAKSLWPGHDKWNYAYSIGELRPDIVAQLWAAGPDDLARIRKYGYERILPKVFVRSDSRLVDRAALERIVCALASGGRIDGPGKGDWSWDWEEVRDRRCNDDPLALR